MENIDIYVKDEGYADFRVLTDKAKEICNKNGFKNSLEEFGEWSEKKKEGRYSFGVSEKDVFSVIEVMEKEGLTIDSEY